MILPSRDFRQPLADCESTFSLKCCLPGRGISRALLGRQCAPTNPEFRIKCSEREQTGKAHWKKKDGIRGQGNEKEWNSSQERKESAENQQQIDFAENQFQQDQSFLSYPLMIRTTLLGFPCRSPQELRVHRRHFLAQKRRRTLLYTHSPKVGTMLPM